MKTIATIKQVKGQLVIELRDEDRTLIDMFPVDTLVFDHIDLYKTYFELEDAE